MAMMSPTAAASSSMAPNRTQIMTPQRLTENRRPLRAKDGKESQKQNKRVDIEHYKEQFQVYKKIVLKERAASGQTAQQQAASRAGANQ